MSLLRRSSANGQISVLLRTFHQAAAKGNLKVYLRCLSADAMFIGTDPTEHWSRQQFEIICERIFREKGGWIYEPFDRKISFADDLSTAWFTERLRHAGYGELLGYGVATKVDGRWKIRLYSMSLPIPNNIFDGVVAQIRELPTAQ